MKKLEMKMFKDEDHKGNDPIKFTNWVKAAAYFVEHMSSYRRIDVKIGLYTVSYFPSNMASFDSFNLAWSAPHVKGRDVTANDLDHLRIRKFDLLRFAISYAMTYKLNNYIPDETDEDAQDAEMRRLLVGMGFSEEEALEIDKYAEPLVG